MNGVYMNKRPKNPAKLLITIPFVLLLGVFVLAIPLTAEETTTATNETCLECHQDMADNLVGTKHALSQNGAKGVTVSCIGCHGSWEAHLDDPEANHPTIASKLGFVEQADVCASCHQGEHQTTMVSTDPHGRAGLDCATCHSIHGNMNAGLVKDDSENYCLGCHQTVGAQFAARSAHPLHDGNVMCRDCHPMNDRKDMQLVKGFDWTCQTCHPDVAGPYVYEHPVNYSHLVNGGGCIECHSPHGSPNERLLNQPKNGVCQQCHGIPAGHRVAHSGMAVKIDCVNCHTQFHGSNDDRLFLDPMLTTTFYANCYASGCHDNLK
jgi:DmsE family decaheme c-type cytochrome